MTRIILCVIIFFAVAAHAESVTGILVTIPEGINITAGEIRSQLPAAIPSGAPYDGIEILVYYFTPGVETLSLSDENEISEKSGKAVLKILVKFKKGGALQKTIFIEAEGRDRVELLKELSMKLGKIF